MSNKFTDLLDFKKEFIEGERSYFHIALYKRSIVYNKLLIVFLLLITAVQSNAQQISFKDTTAAYNKQRIAVNERGMKVLGAWGIANMVDGGVGYFTAKQDQWKDFHAMNAAWGLVNTGIAAMGMHGVRKELAANLNSEQAYKRYLDNKKLYLVNIGFDVFYVGAGAGLAVLGAHDKSNGPLYKGFGSSIAMQGIFLLLFDNVMFASQERNNSKWFLIMNEIRVSNHGVGFSHTF